MPANDPNRVIRCDITEPIEEVAAFWTEERMKKAKPASPRGRPKAGGRRGREVRSQQLPPPATLNAVSNVKILPYSAVGRLFFTDIYGKDSVATAWIVGESTIATAGHCVGQYDPGEMAPQWSFRMMFCPQYSGGQYPLGKYSMQTYFVLQGWIEGEGEGEEWNYDLAMCQTRDPMPLDKTGILSFEPNIFTAVNTSVLAIGYPGDDRQYGGLMYESNGQFLFNTDSESEERASNALPLGASGGPWLVKLESGLGTVVGINSTKDADVDEWSSSYFGDGMVNLLNAALDE